MRNGLQYKHYPDQGQTFAVHPPALEILEEAMAYHICEADCEVAFAIGRSRVHPEDQYSKAEGRKISYSKLKMVKLKVKHFFSGDGKIYMTLTGNRYSVDLVIRKNKEVAVVAEIIKKN